MNGSKGLNINETILDTLRSIVGVEAVLTGDSDKQTYGKDWLTDFKPAPAVIVLPRTALEVQKIVQLCNQEQIALVPSGGRTGLSGGATATQGEIILSLSRMNSVVGINTVDRTITCEAGVVTQKIQESAAERGLYFPVDFASKGSSQIGGNIATNAGGIRVIRYGNIRDWVLGLKVVTPTGELLELNGSLFKNQTGYDLRSLYIGSEGTLGIIVEATLRLTSPPGELIRMLCGLDTIDKVLTLLERVRTAFPLVSVFEYFTPEALEQVVEQHSLRAPFSEKMTAYVLIELEYGDTRLRENAEEVFSKFLEDELILDVLISQNSKQSDELLKYRELISETLSARHTLHKNDISVPIPSIPQFIHDLEGTIACSYPDYRVVVFGHIGDGNLHINVLKPPAVSSEDFFAFCKKADQDLFGLVQRYRGSISAEHGVGLLKRDFLSFSRAPEEITMMKTLKRALDPNGILNPGKIFEL